MGCSKQGSQGVRKAEGRGRKAAPGLSERDYEALVEGSADGIVVLDGQGTVLFTNSAAAKMFHGEAPPGDEFGVHLTPGTTAEISLPSRGPGSRIAEIRTAVIRWRGRPALLATLRDVTERKQAEDESRAAIRRRDEFLATLSHELRNPLSAVSNAAIVMRNPALGPEASGHARDIIERQCRQMTRLLEDLLDVSRVSQGKIELRRDCHCLQTIVGEAADAVAAAMQEREQQLELSGCDEQLFAEVDAVRFHQVLVNLLSNASKYSDRRAIIWLILERSGDDAVLTVRDAGIGMSEEMLKQVFEPFVQAGGSVSRSNGGLGIGLWLVRTIVELHGGTVSARSEGSGRGSEFTVRLPVSSAVPAPRRPPRPQRTGRGLRVLVVEDSPDNRYMLKTLLELEGHEVEAVEDGQRGLQMIEFQRPDVALVDIGLPVLDGYELARQVRENPEHDDVFLVALTGYGQLKDRRRAFQAGFDAHLPKPVDFDELSRVLTDCSRQKASSWSDGAWVDLGSAS